MDDADIKHVFGAEICRSGINRKRKHRITNFHSIADLIARDDQLKDEDNTQDIRSLLVSKALSTHLITDETYCRMIEVKRSLSMSNSGSNASNALTKDSIKTGQTCTSSKKSRTMYKTEQVNVLEQMFSKTQYPDPNTIDDIAKQVGIPDTKIKVWFQNKRARCRRRTSGEPRANHKPTSGNRRQPSLHDEVKATSWSRDFKCNPFSYLPLCGKIVGGGLTPVTELPRLFPTAFGAGSPLLSSISGMMTSYPDVATLGRTTNMIR